MRRSTASLGFRARLLVLYFWRATRRSSLISVRSKDISGALALLAACGHLPARFQAPCWNAIQRSSRAWSLSPPPKRPSARRRTETGPETGRATRFESGTGRLRSRSERVPLAAFAFPHAAAGILRAIVSARAAYIAAVGI